MIMEKTGQRSLEEDFGRMWPEVVRLLLRYLLANRAAFGGDMDKVIILAVIGQQAMKGPGFAELTLEALAAAVAVESAAPGSNVQSIADSTGIPRETVRRKVAEMTELGWVSRSEDGLLRPTIKASQDLAPLIKEIIAILGSLQGLLNGGTNHRTEGGR